VYAPSDFREYDDKDGSCCLDDDEERGNGFADGNFRLKRTAA
jgi:hypothetical protein